MCNNKINKNLKFIIKTTKIKFLKRKSRNSEKITHHLQFFFMRNKIYFSACLIIVCLLTIS